MTESEIETLVTIVTPTYNHGRYIERCIRSVQAQAHTRWEMVIVDDASSDGTGDIVRRLATHDPRIRLVERAVRRGPYSLADSYAQAMERSDGELVALLDGDDWWARDKLACQVAVLERNPSVVLCYGDCWEVTDDGRRIERLERPISRLGLKTSVREDVTFFAGLGSFPANTVVIRRDELDRVGGFLADPDLPVVDYPTWLALSLEGDFVRIPRPLAYWRRHAGSVYWRNLGETQRGCHGYFLRFLDRNRAPLEAAGLDAIILKRTADEALAMGRKTLPYFDAKYELLCGDRRLARRKLLDVMVDRDAMLRHRMASVLGLVSTLSSPRLFSGVLASRRMMASAGHAVTPRSRPGS